MEIIWKTLDFDSHLGEKILQLLDDETIRNLRLVSKSERFTVDVHTDFWKRKLIKIKTHQHYFSRGEHNRIRKVFLKNLNDAKREGTEQTTIDEIKAFVGIMDECRLRKKAFLHGEVRKTIQQAHDRAFARMKANKIRHRENPYLMASDEMDTNKTWLFDDPFEVASQLDEFGFRFWKLFWEKTAFGFKWPQKGHQWISDYGLISSIVLGNRTGFLVHILNNLDFNEINHVW